MPLPIRHLPVLQNWDCHVCGTCCQEYVVTVTDEEKKRIDAQGWDRDKDLGGHVRSSGTVGLGRGNGDSTTALTAAASS